MNPDLEGLVAELKKRGAIPLVVLYGIPKDGGVDLDFLTTPAYEDADAQLKSDTAKAVSDISNNL